MSLYDEAVKQGMQKGATVSILEHKLARARKHERVRMTAKVKGRCVGRAPRAWTH